MGARIDWINPNSSGNELTEVNNPSFTADDGYDFDGSTTSVDTNFNPSTSGTAYAADDAAFGIWADNTTQSGGAWGGAFGSGGNTAVGFYRGSGDVDVAINKNTSWLQVLHTQGENLLCVDTNSTRHAAYLNGVEVNTDTSFGQTLINETFAIGRLNGDSYFFGGGS